MRLLLTALLTGLLAAAPAAARPAVERSADLWATVNVCDTPRFPDRIGVRGSMPGLGRRAVLYMRFQVQYVSRADGKWHNVGRSADTGHVRVGVARGKVLEAGHTFKFLPPAGGGAHTLRGAVTFTWKVRGRTVKRVRELTEAGHRSTTADPPGYSAAICKIA